MSGALVDLVAKGVQDAYLTGQPEVSFFRQNYKRHTNFALKPVQLNPVGQLVANGEVTLKIPNKGDLLSYIWIDLGNDEDTTNVSSNCINSILNTGSTEFELYIGGQFIDRQDAVFTNQIWNRYLADSQAKCLNEPTKMKWLPLHFFFCDGPYLPLVALQYHEVELRVKFGAGDLPSGIKFYANYVVLDTTERDNFVNRDHEILIEQVQKISSAESSNTRTSERFDLSLLNHPVKALFWSNAAVTTSTSTSTLTNDVQMYLNGTEVFNAKMPNRFFTNVQGFEHSEYGSDFSNDNGPGENIKMYSFALKANKHQPCGSCNFSRLDNADLLVNSLTRPVDGFMNLHAVNYNILRIKKGMAGVAFSN